MEFDVVIGNPPYNKDIYLDFVTLSHSISNGSVCMITPAKWQAKSDSKNERFREKIVPYISKAVFYKNTKDIFDIAEPGGISYFLLEKEKAPEKLIKTVCIRNRNFESEGFEPHDEQNLLMYNHKILSLLGKIGMLDNGFDSSKYVRNIPHGEDNISKSIMFRRQVFISEQDKGEEYPSEIEEYVEVTQGDRVVGYKKKKDLFTTENLDKYKCIQACMSAQGSGEPFKGDSGLALGSGFIMIIGPNQVPKGSFQILKYFDTYDEAFSFKSYINSKTMSLMQFIGLCGSTMTDTFFRFIPDPKDWSMIYEDKPLEGYKPDNNGIYLDNNGIRHCSLYVKYKLTESEINTIESIIRERKAI